MADDTLTQLAGERVVLTVSELTHEIKGLLESKYRDVWVRGEISNFKRHSSGHWYFTLKDPNAQVRCASFRLQNRLIRFDPEDGLEVYARGRISVYEPRGDYQLIVEHLEPVGIGSLQLAYEQLKSKLAAEGLFDPSRKRPLPLYPRKVGIITSPTGAAIRDMLRVLKRRNAGVSVLLCPVAVQGAGAAEQIARGIELMNRRDDLDVLIVGRGGGSMEDLWAFNEEIVARAIASSRIPVLSAVGHETDFTIADFVADLRAPTPSAAAEQVAARREDLINIIRTANVRLAKAIHLMITQLHHSVSDIQARRGLDQATYLLQRYIQRVDELGHRLQLTVSMYFRDRREQFTRATQGMAGIGLRQRVAQYRGHVDVQEQRLIQFVSRHIELHQRQFHVIGGKLSALSPLAVLERGYAIVRGPRLTILRRADDVSVGDQLRVRLAYGHLLCSTLEVNDDDQNS